MHIRSLSVPAKLQKERCQEGGPNTDWNLTLLSTMTIKLPVKSVS